MILAQPQEVIAANLTGQPEPFRSKADPFAGHAFPFIVVVANAEMFLKVFARVLEVVLCLRRDHTRTLHGLSAHLV